MDLRKSANAEKLILCRRYFYVGIACLPFLWAVNFLWFFSEAFRRPLYTEQKQIRFFTALSGIGALAWLLAIIGWNVYFQSNRATLPWGDDMSFIIPIGRA